MQTESTGPGSKCKPAEKARTETTHKKKAHTKPIHTRAGPPGNKTNRPDNLDQRDQLDKSRSTAQTVARNVRNFSGNRNLAKGFF